MNLIKLQQQLEAIGFKIASNPLRNKDNQCSWIAYRRSNTPARECECNEGKPVQIVITPHVFTLNGYCGESVDIEICAQHEEWWRLQAYGIRFDDLIERLPEIEAGLLRAWNALEKPEVQP